MRHHRLVTLVLFAAGCAFTIAAHAQMPDDDVQTTDNDACLQRCESYRQACSASAQGDNEALGKCETQVTTPCIDACREGRSFTPPPYPTPAPKCTADEWGCGDWSACSTAGTQTRTCTMTTSCDTAETPSPVTSQSCTPPAPPTPAPAPTPEPEPTPEQKQTTPPSTTPPASTSTNTNAGAPPTTPPADTPPAPTPEPTPEPAPTDTNTPPDAAPDNGGTFNLHQPGAALADAATQQCAVSGLTPTECRDFLVLGLGFEDCAAQGIVTRNSCVEYLSGRNNGIFPGCEGATPERCTTIKDLVLIRYLSDEAKKLADALIAERLLDKSVTPEEGITSISEASARDATWWRSSQGEGSETSAGVVVVDADRDGLPDDLERSLGLDPNDGDSDNDGITDDDELRAGLSGLDDTARALVTRQPLGQPHGQGSLDTALSATLEGGKLYGFCDPNATCLIFVYSYVPTVFTVQADANGQFEYQLDDQIADGSHVAYVTVNEDNGNVARKSNPLAFFVSEAQAVSSADEFLGGETSPLVQAQTQEEPSTKMFLWGVLAAILATACIAYAVVVKRKPAA